MSTEPIIKEIRDLQILKKPNSQIWNAYASDIIIKIKQLENVASPSERQDTILHILLLLKIFGHDICLFLQLGRQQLCDGVGFEDLPHCELVLSSLISLAHVDISSKKHKEYKAVLDELQVGHDVHSTLIFFYPCYRVLEEELAYPSHSVLRAPAWSTNYQLGMGTLLY